MSTTAHFSIAEYDRLVRTGVLEGRRLELIHGQIREMSPIGPIHEDIVDLLTRWSFASTDASQIRVRVQHSVGVAASDSAPEPDIVWVKERSYRDGRPGPSDITLLIEVADSSLAYDLGEKAELYAASGVSDYWVVDVKSESVVVHRTPGESGYSSVATFGRDAVIATLYDPDLTLDVATLFPTA